MTAEAFTRRWVRAYTRGLRDEVRATRRNEIDSDLHEHRTTGAPGVAIVGRTLRGVPADVSWRREERRTMEATTGRLTGARAVWAVVTQAWFTPVAVLLGLLDAFGAVVVLFDIGGNGKGSGRVGGPIVLLALSVALFAGLRLRWRSAADAPAPASGPAAPARTALRSPLRVRLGLIALAFAGVVAVIFGIMGAVPLLAVGVLALGGAAVIAARRRGGGARVAPATTRPHATGAQNVMLADVLIILGTLPALGLFWLVVPAILALIVIGGVIGTGPGTRRRAAFSA